MAHPFDPPKPPFGSGPTFKWNTPEVERPDRRSVDLPPWRTDAVYAITYGEPPNVYALSMRDMEGEEIAVVDIPGILSWYELRQEQRLQMRIYGSTISPWSRGWRA